MGVVVFTEHTQWERQKRDKQRRRRRRKKNTKQKLCKIQKKSFLELSHIPIMIDNESQKNALTKNEMKNASS